ncbi:MAG: PaaX family transcriptional regulator C-terminal domain-containing protein [Burkholderiales bacterium]
MQRTLAADPPRAKSLIVTVWGDALAPHGGGVWLSGLIRLMAPFGVNDRLVRTSVFRLARDGWLDSASHGRVSRYRLTSDGARRFDDAHRRIYDRPGDDWHGRWELVVVGALPAAPRASLRDELTWAGFGELAANVFVRPSEAHRPLPSVLRTPAVAGHAVVADATDVPGQPPLAAAVEHAWDLAALAADYRRFLQRFGQVIDRFRDSGEHEPAGPSQGRIPERAARRYSYTPAQCFVVRTLLIHAYRRVLLRDPLLPASLLPLDWPGAAAYALCRDFYRLTHRCAERHLAATLAANGDPFPPANPAFYARFGGLEG